MMKLLGFKRFPFKGQMWLPKEDEQSQNANIFYEFEKDVMFDFSDDPSAPRQLFVSDEPFPVSARILVVTDRYGTEPVPGAQWTVTTIEPIINVFGFGEGFRHQAALTEQPKFGYEVASVNG